MPSLSDKRRLQIYMDDDGRKQADALLKILADQYPDIMIDHTNRASLSAMIRWLIKQEMERQTQ